MENLKRLFKSKRRFKTMIVFHKAERLIRASEAHILKSTSWHQLNSLYLRPCTARAISAFKIWLIAFLRPLEIRTVVIRTWSAMDGLHAKPIQKTAVLILFLLQMPVVKDRRSSSDHIKIFNAWCKVFNSGEQAELTELLEEIQTYRLSLLLKTILTPKSSILEFSSCILFI